MNIDQLLLLGSIVVPLLTSISLFLGLGKTDLFIKNVSYFGFLFPLVSGIILFLNFDSSFGGYCFEVFYPQMGLQNLILLFTLV